MKTINTAFLYMVLTVALFTRYVSPLCGNDDQIDDLNTAILVHKSSVTLLTTLSAVPLTGAALTVVQISSSVHFSIHLYEVFDEMENSLDESHQKYHYCYRLLKNTRLSAGVIESTGVGLSLASMIPGVGMGLVAPRLVSSIAAMVAIRNGLLQWKEHNCKAATTRDCHL